MAIHSGFLALEIPWREEPGGLQSIEFPGDSVVQNLPASAGDLGSIP